MFLEAASFETASFLFCYSVGIGQGIYKNIKMRYFKGKYDKGQGNYKEQGEGQVALQKYRACAKPPCLVNI